MNWTSYITRIILFSPLEKNNKSVMNWYWLHNCTENIMFQGKPADIKGTQKLSQLTKKFNYF
jgi:hypothetical protein